MTESIVPTEVSTSSQIHLDYASSGRENLNDGKEITQKLSQLDEKLHVEEKIKDGAENLLQVFDTTQSEHQVMLRKQVEDALTKANNNISKLIKDIEYFKTIPNTPIHKKETPPNNQLPAFGSTHKLSIDQTSHWKRSPLNHNQISNQEQIDNSKASISLGSTLITTLANLNDPKCPLDKSQLTHQRLETLSTLTNVLKRSFRVRYEIDQNSLIDAVKHCLSDNAGPSVRTLAYRLLRYSLIDRDSANIYISQGVNFYLIRTLANDNSAQIEKEQAIYFIRSLIDIGGSDGLLLDQSIVRAVISIAENSEDPLRYLCLEILAEIALFDMELLSKSQGLHILLLTLTGSSPDLTNFAPAIASLFCYIIDNPLTRKFLQPGIDLEIALTAFTDVPSAHFRASNARIERLKCASKILVVLLKSWSGLFYFCANDRGALKTLVDALRVPSQELREILLDLFFELLNIKIPSWYAASLEGKRQTMYNRSTGQRKAPERSHQDTPNSDNIKIVDHFIALLMIVFIESGLIENLTTIVEEKNEVLTKKATLLLGELLRKGNRVLPSSFAAKLQALPRLFALAAEYSGEARLPACSALATIDHFNRVRNRPIPSHAKDSRKRSNSLDDPMRRGQRQVEQVKMRIGMQIDDKSFHAMLLESQVLVTKDNVRWNYDVVFDLLEGPLLNPKRLDEAIRSTKFIKRLLSFYHPFNLRFSNTKKTKPNMRWVRLGCQLITTLLNCEEGRRYLGDDKMMRQIGECFAQLDPLNTNQNLTGMEPLFSRNRLENTLSIGYFEILGTISKIPEGIELLERHKLFTSFYRISELRSREDLIKAIVEKLDYSHSGHARIILSKALTSSYKHVRQFATQHLGEIILSSPKANEWALDLLITQLYDPAVEICEFAVRYLEKVCESVEILELVVSMMPSLDHLGEIGHPLMLRFLSTSVGFNYLRNSEYIDRQIEDWFHERNAHYVVLIEVYLSNALGMNNLDYDDVNDIEFNGTVPSHFYGELTKTYEGCEVLAEKGHFGEFAEFLRRHGLESKDTDIIYKLKSVLWAVGTIGSTPYGLPFLIHEDIIKNIIEIAENSLFVSVKGTCYFVLGLIASTESGIVILDGLGWQSTRSPLGQPLGLCLPKDVNKFINIPKWETPNNDEMWPAFVLEEPTKNSDKLVMNAVIDLSNQLVVTGASRSLMKLKTHHKSSFKSISTLSRVFHFMEHFHYRAQARKFILDAFDIEFNDDNIKELMKCSEDLKSTRKNLKTDFNNDNQYNNKLKSNEDISEIINDEIGILINRAKRKGTFDNNDKPNILGGSMDSDEESDIELQPEAAKIKGDELVPLKTIVGGFTNEQSPKYTPIQPMRLARFNT